MTTQEPNILITRTFQATPEKVFEAWIDPAQFGRWFGTESMAVEDVALNPEVGGTWSARMILGDGTEIGWHGSYLEVDAPHRLVLTLSDRPGDVYELVTVLLQAVDGGTEMTFSQAGNNMPPENYAQAEEGWRTFFDDLAKGLPH